MRAAVYARVSTADQLEGYSIQAQLDACLHHASSHSMTVVARYIDEGISAATPNPAKRPAWAAMMAAASRHEFDTIIVHKLDRFCRNLRLLLDAFQQLADAGVELVSLSDKTAYNTPSDKLSVHVLASVAEWFSANLGAEVRKGKAARRAAGLSNGHYPYGTTKGPGGYAVPDTRPLDNGSTPYAGLQLAYRLAAEGQSDSKVALALNSAGYRLQDRAGSRLFTSNTIAGMLPNRIYVGEVADGAGGWQPGQHAALVEPEVFERALEHRRRRLGNRGPHSSPAGVFALTGLVQCGYCGGKVWLYSPQQTARYRAWSRCSTRHRRRTCEQPGVAQEVWERQVGDWLRRLVIPDGAVERAIARLSVGETVPDNTPRIEAALSRLREMYQWGDISRAEYQSQAAELRRQLEAARPAPVTDWAGIARSLEGIGQAWDDGTAEERHQIAVAVLERIVVRGQAVVEVVWRPEVAALLGDT